MFFKKANACKKVEIPPKEIIKHAKTVAIFLGIKTDDSIKQPFVISPSPQKIDDISEPFIPRLENQLIVAKNILLEVITSKITNEKQITPPISNIEFTDDVILCEKSNN